MAKGRRWPWRRQRQDAQGEKKRELEAGLQETRLRIAQAYAGFNAAADGDLVESFVYEIQSLHARYSYLLRQRKALEGEETAAAPAHRAVPVA